MKPLPLSLVFVTSAILSPHLPTALSIEISPRALSKPSVLSLNIFQERDGDYLPSMRIKGRGAIPVPLDNEVGFLSRLKKREKRKLGDRWDRITLRAIIARRAWGGGWSRVQMANEHICTEESLLHTNKTRHASTGSQTPNRHRKQRYVGSLDPSPHLHHLLLRHVLLHTRSLYVSSPYLYPTVYPLPSPPRPTSLKKNMRTPGY